MGEDTVGIDGVEISLWVGSGITTFGASGHSVEDVEDEPRGGKELYRPGDVLNWRSPPFDEIGEGGRGV